MFRGGMCVSVSVYGHRICVHVCMGRWACDLSTHLPVCVCVCVSTCLPVCPEAGALNTKLLRVRFATFPRIWGYVALLTCSLRQCVCMNVSLSVCVCVCIAGGVEGNSRPNNFGQCLGQEGTNPGPSTCLLCGPGFVYTRGPPLPPKPSAL